MLGGGRLNTVLHTPVPFSAHVCLAPGRRTRLYFGEVNAVFLDHIKILRVVHRAFKKTTKIAPDTGKKIEIVHIGSKDTVYMSLWGWFDFCTEVGLIDEVRAAARGAAVPPALCTCARTSTAVSPPPPTLTHLRAHVAFPFTGFHTPRRGPRFPVLATAVFKRQ